METADIIIKNGTILTQNNNREIIRNGSLIIRGNRIIYVGGNKNIDYKAKKIIDAKNKIVLPGFINSHTHVIQILLRGGVSSDKTLYDWLFNVLFPALAVYTKQDAEIAVKLYCAEAIKSGITTIVDNADIAQRNEIAEAALEAYKKIGIRVNYARLFIDKHPEDSAFINEIKKKVPTVKHVDTVEDTDSALSSIKNLIEKYHNSASGRIRVCPSPHIPGLCTKKAILKSMEIVEKYDTLIPIHLAENPFDNKVPEGSSTKALDKIGFLNKRILAAHCIYLDEEDIDLLKKNNVKIAYNPVSNLFLSSGLARIDKLIQKRIIVGLGTDDVNCNGNVNMLKDMKFAKLIQNLNKESALKSSDIIDMVTIKGAEAIGMANEIGSIEVGKKADVIILNLNRIHLTPCFNIYDTIVEQSLGNEIDTVIIDSNIVMEDRRLNFLKETEEELILKAQKASEEIIKRSGIRSIRN